MTKVELEEKINLTDTALRTSNLQLSRIERGLNNELPAEKIDGRLRFKVSVDKELVQDGGFTDNRYEELTLDAAEIDVILRALGQYHSDKKEKQLIDLGKAFMDHTFG